MASIQVSIKLQGTDPYGSWEDYHCQDYANRLSCLRDIADQRWLFESSISMSTVKFEWICLANGSIDSENPRIVRKLITFPKPVKAQKSDHFYVFYAHSNTSQFLWLQYYVGLVKICVLYFVQKLSKIALFFKTIWYGL